MWEESWGVSRQGTRSAERLKRLTLTVATGATVAEAEINYLLCHIKRLNIQWPPTLVSVRHDARWTGAWLVSFLTPRPVCSHQPLRQGSTKQYPHRHSWGPHSISISDKGTKCRGGPHSPPKPAPLLKAVLAEPGFPPGPSGPPAWNPFLLAVYLSTGHWSLHQQVFRAHWGGGAVSYKGTNIHPI